MQLFEDYIPSRPAIQKYSLYDYQVHLKNNSQITLLVFSLHISIISNIPMHHENRIYLHDVGENKAELNDLSEIDQRLLEVVRECGVQQNKVFEVYSTAVVMIGVHESTIHRIQLIHRYCLPIIHWFIILFMS